MNDQEKFVQLQLPKDLVDQLSHAASQQGVTVTELLRQMFKDYDRDYL